jgi:hypothetical protein
MTAPSVPVVFIHGQWIHSTAWLVLDHGWREVADLALSWLRQPGPVTPRYQWPAFPSSWG